MKALLNRLAAGMAQGLGIVAAVLLVANAYALSVPTFTGVSGSNPITGTVPGIMPDLNTLINNINAFVQMNFQATTNSSAGEPQFTNAAAFAQNAGVATALTSVGPVGSHTTVQKWLTVVDNAGALFYAPLF